MDFGTLLHVAKKNSENTRNEGKYYCTKYAPPKKESKEKKLSENIQKFLQKKEQEERERQRIAKEKRDQLIASRDEKSKNKIKKMLKVIKSANKSVLEDAVNNEHTALTMEGPDQPDQDDYGYTSQEAAAFYQKYIEKVKDVKEEKYFAPSRPHTRTDLMGTKDRVKAALNRENDEKSTHHHSVTSSSTSSSSSHRSHSSLRPAYDPEAERLEDEKKKREEEQKKAKQRKPAPPPMDFKSLLKLAEKKQFEPILIPVEVKKEPTRLLTSKEKRELEERQKYLEEREKRRNGETQQLSSTNHKTKGGGGGGGDERTTNGIQRMEPNGRIPKLGSTNNINKPTTSKSAAASTSSTKITNKPQSSTSSSAAKSGNDSTFKKPNHPASLSSLKSVNSVDRASQRPAPKPSLSKGSTPSQTNESREKQLSHKSSSASVLANGSSSISKKPSYPPREFPPRDNIKNIQRKPTSGADNQRRESMNNQKTREYPPVNDRRNTGATSQRPSMDRRKAQQQQLVPQKRRIYDDDDEDDEEEYDSDLADFIDDGDAEEDYSSHIKEIFGYDRSRYRDMELDDDAEMESSFAQQQREEFISKKIGLMEDLEDMKQEAIDKKRKAMMKKRKL